MTNAPRDDRPRGIVCPKCGGRRLTTTNTEPLPDGRIRRRKRCRRCRHKIVTFEAAAESFFSSDCQV